MSKQIKKCYNCKYSSKGFKVGRLTHHHCMSPTFEEQNKSGDPPSPWDTLVVFSESCEEHEFKELKKL